jgi:Beta-propeller repeat
MRTLRLFKHGSAIRPATILFAAAALLGFVHSGAAAASPTDGAGKSAATPVRPALAAPKTLVPGHGRLPIVFVPHRVGDLSGVLYRAHGAGLDVLLRKSGVTFLREIPVAAGAGDMQKPAASTGGAGPIANKNGSYTIERQSIEFVGGNSDVAVEALDAQPGKASYFQGNDPKLWAAGLPTYARVRYRNLYPGIDLIFYSSNGQLEYDFVVASGADPGKIRLRLDGTDPVELTAGGELEVGTGAQAVLHRPQLYQNLSMGKKLVGGRFRRLDAETVGFICAGYDRSKTLVIDPAIKLVYSTYMGGQHDDEANAIAVDAAGDAYIVGYSASQDYPVTGNAYQIARMDIGTYTYDVVIMKFDPSGTLLYSTFLGGSQTDEGGAVVIDAAGDAWLGGSTYSSDFPVTQGAYQGTYGGGKDAFLAEISPDGSGLLYSTYLGGAGDEYIGSMILNSDGSMWMSGGASAAGLPASSGAFQTKPNGADNYFVGKVTFSQTTGAMQIPYLTFIGGSNSNEEAFWGSLALDATGNVYLAGGTQSPDYPVTSNAYQKPFPLSDGCYAGTTPNSIPTLTKFSPDLTKALYSTVIGGQTEALGGGEPDCNQFALSIHLDAQGNIWLTGTTGMSDFPVTSNAISKQLGTNGQAGVDFFLAELSADGSKELYGTFLGGSAFDYAARGVWDANNNIWISGTTASTDFPVTSNALQSANAGGYDATLTELSPDGTKILYSTYLGGNGDDGLDGDGVIAIDGSGNIHLAGETASTNFPETPTAFQQVFANGDLGADSADIFYSVLGSGIIGTVTPPTAGNTGDTTITINGAGFEPGATCTITMGGTTLTATATSVNATGTSISCTFSLNGAAAGSYSVQVTDPNGGSTFTKAAALTVDSGGQPNVWVNIVGRPKIRVGVSSIVTVNYGNSGTVDAYFTGLKVAMPPNVSASYNVGVTAGTAKSSAATTASVSSTGSTIPLLIPHLAPGTSGSFLLTISDAVNNDNYAITATIGHPWYTSATDAEADLTAQSQTFTAASTCATPSQAIPGVYSCLGPYLTALQTGGLSTAQVQSVAGNMLTMLHQSQTGPAPVISGTTIGSSSLQFETGTFIVNGVPSTDNEVLFHVTNTSQQYLVPINSTNCVPTADNINDAIGGSLLTCTYSNVTAPVQAGVTFAGVSMSLGASSQVLPQPDTCFTVVQDIAATTFSVTANAGDCHNDVDAPEDPEDDPEDIPFIWVDPIDPGGDDPNGGGSSGTSSGGTAGSIDPNGKTGAAGDMSASHYIRGGVPVPYDVYFENKPSATLPAAQVVVTDQLDATKINLSTVTLGSFSFGNTTINPPAGVNSYNSLYNISTSLSVRVQGSVNTQTGLVKWTFTSIDPTTGLPPSDPTVGFLPPDTDGVQGQGSVLFTALPVSGLTTGTKISNMATVVFDSNASINTPTFTNTIDVDAPKSSVTALPATTTQTSFTVAWSGTDAGSGIATFNIYVSDNSGAFTLWQSAVTTTSASYTGTVGHTYGFFSQATDKVGNQETLKTTADTTMEVVPVSPPDFNLSSSVSTFSVSPGGSGSSTISVTPENGFNTAVSFACSGLPALATCSFTPATITPSGGAASTTTLTIATTGTSAKSVPPSPWGAGGVALSAMLLGFLARKRRGLWLALLACAVAFGFTLTGCGSGGSTTPPQGGTPAGTSTVTVTASSGSGTSALSHTSTITLTVQ